MVASVETTVAAQKTANSYCLIMGPVIIKVAFGFKRLMADFAHKLAYFILGWNWRNGRATRV